VAPAMNGGVVYAACCRLSPYVTVPNQRAAHKMPGEMNDIVGWQAR